MGNKKKGLLAFLFVVLCMPLAQQCLPFIDSGQLHGFYSNAPDVTFSWEQWFKGTYQEGKGKFVNDHLGFRQDLLRLNNQVDYSFFDKCHCGWTLAGKDHYLYQEPYINAYFGKDFSGYTAIRDQCAKLKAIKDTFERMGKSLIVVHAASKVTSYPEYLPERCAHEQKGITNSEVYKRLLDSCHIDQVDADSWFLSMKHTSREPLFSKQGIHWTVYGAILAADSVVRYIEQLRHIRMPHMVWSQVERTTKLRGGDDDIASELNLIFPVATETMSYPVLQEEPHDSTKKKLSVIYLGDSFGFKMVVSGGIGRLNSASEYWSYFDEVHGIVPDRYTYIGNYDWKAALDKTDCFVMVYTTFNFNNFGNGFIDAAYKYYYPNK